MTLEQLSKLKVGDQIYNNGSGLTYIILEKINYMKYIAVHTAYITNPEEWERVRIKRSEL